MQNYDYLLKYYADISKREQICLGYTYKNYITPINYKLRAFLYFCTTNKQNLLQNRSILNSNWKKKCSLLLESSTIQAQKHLILFHHFSKSYEFKLQSILIIVFKLFHKRMYTQKSNDLDFTYEHDCAQDAKELLNCFETIQNILHKWNRDNLKSSLIEKHPSERGNIIHSIRINLHNLKYL